MGQALRKSRKNRILVMTLKKLGCLVILVLQLTTECLGDQVSNRKLNIPADGGERLYPIDGQSFRVETMRFNTLTREDIAASIYCCPFWYSPFATLLCRNGKGGYSIVGINFERSRGAKEMDAYRNEVQVDFEAKLALRVLKLLKREFGKIVAGTSEKRVFLDTATYYYSLSEPDARHLLAKTVDVGYDTRLGRVNRLAGMLNSFAFAPEAERTGILNEIDWVITEIELAEK